MQEEFEDEVFKVIGDYDNYSVSSHGRVKNNRTGYILKPMLDRYGYYRVDLRKHNARKMYRVHRLVAIAFIENTENKACVDHIDNCKINNHIFNLRWCTAMENLQNQSLSKNNTSGTKGVSFNKLRKKWHARIMIKGVRFHLGLFDNLEDAKKARVTRAKDKFGIHINSCELG